MREARNAGYRIELHYTCVESHTQALRRIRTRVAQGGHDVPEQDAKRRYARSHAQLPIAIGLADETRLHDNDARGRNVPVRRYRRGTTRLSPSRSGADRTAMRRSSGPTRSARREHLVRVKKLDEADAAEQLFDFRVADVAMGSGHFLIAAIDRIEKAMADFLAERHLPRVRQELDALRGAAKRELGELAETASIEEGSYCAA